MRTKNKISVLFTIDTNVFEEFKTISTEKSINRSNLVTKLLKKWMEENK